MKLHGLKVNFLGDSITEGYCASDLENTSYWALLRNRDGVEARCYGVAGTRLAARVQTVPAAAAFDHPFSERALDMNHDADVVIVFGGTNDYGHGDAPIGSPEDRSMNTFYGAVNHLCTILKKEFPDSRILFMTPLHREFEEGINGCNEFGEPLHAPLSTYVDIIKSTAERFGFQVLDMYRECKIDPKVPQQKALYTADGLHPNDAGHEIIYEMVRDCLKQMS